MSDHSSSVFNNNCLKLPINPRNTRPLAIYEQKLLNQLQNEATKLSQDPTNEETMKTRVRDSAKSYLEFFGSIPEYDELNHLSNKEFYEKVESLKERQKKYSNLVENDIVSCSTSPEWLAEYKQYAKKATNKTKKEKPFCVTPILTKKRYDDVEFLSDREMGGLKPPSRRSVRIETPSEKSSPESVFKRPKSGFSKKWDEWENFSDEIKLDLDDLSSKSAPTSPLRSKTSVGWKDNGITIPKPFDMTIKDEENKILDEILQKSKDPKGDLFKAHPVPIESQIPLFEKIMADQERKNQRVRERSKALLQSQMRPFSFTRRDEEIQKLTKGLSKSSPSLCLEEPPLKIKKFKAKPIPKNLFSNYIYKKMHEDEFYRALQRKIRAEELLRASSLPPSMAKRERTMVKYDVCPRSYREILEKPKQRNFDREMEDLKNDLLNCNISRAKIRRKLRKNRRHFSASSSDSRTPNSLDLQVHRSNLAALLRVQAARRKLELEMCRKVEECKLKEEARWREKVMRRKPVWQALAYSHEEDLAMRLQLRREEERLRSEEHKLRMELMLGRVNKQPTLFERQSKVKLPKTRDELLDQLYCEYQTRRDLKDPTEESVSIEEEEKCEGTTSSEEK